MRYLLDTDVLIEYARGCAPATVALQQMIDQGDEPGVCAVNIAVNIAEFFAGLPPPQRSYWETVFPTLTCWAISAPAARRAGALCCDVAR